MNICAELRPRIVAFLDGELTDAEAATVASHLEACDECRAERQMIVATRELLGEIPAPAPAPDAWKRLRREIRPAPRVSRAWNAPIPMWAAGSMAAGFLGLAVLFNAGTEPVRTESDDGGGVVQPVDPKQFDGRRVKPAAPGALEGHEPKIDHPGATGPEPAAPHTVTPTPPEDDETSPSGPSVAVPEPRTADPLPPVDPQPVEPSTPAPPEEHEPATPAGPGVEHSRPVTPSTPTQVQWESVQLSPVDAPRLPQTPAFMAEAVAFNPTVGLPVPRGAGLVPVQELENGDLRIDRGGEGKAAHFFTIKRRTASRSGVTFPLRIQRGEEPTQLLRVTVRKNGDTWLFQNRTARRGKWLDRTVLLLDGNHNGRYDDQGADVVIFGERAEVVPVSDVLLTAQGLTEFKTDRSGGRFAVRPYTGPTGLITLEASYNGSGRATSVVVNSGDHYFEIATRGTAPITVPAGTYTVSSGLMVSKHARMKILPGESAAVEVGADDVAPAAVVLGGQCAMEYGLDGDPEQGWVSVALTSIAVRGGAGELYEPLGEGLKLVSFQLRDGEGRLLKQQKASPTRCPKNNHARFGVKLPNSVKRVSDVSVQMFAPAYEKAFGSVTGTYPEKRR